MRILIAEDNPVNQKLIELICRKGGYETLIVDNGEAAVETVMMGGIALVLMDIMMPGMDGIEAARRIRSLPDPLGATPIYAVSAYASAENRAECQAAGIDGFVSKPIRPADLLKIVGKVMAAPAAIS